jgi:hypothetical protein
MMIIGAKSISTLMDFKISTICWMECIVEYDEVFNSENNPMHLHYLDEGNACVNCVGYDIVNVSI